MSGSDVDFPGLLNKSIRGFFHSFEWYPLCHMMLYRLCRIGRREGFISLIILLDILSGPGALLFWRLFISFSISFLVIAMGEFR